MEVEKTITVTATVTASSTLIPSPTATPDKIFVQCIEPTRSLVSGLPSTGVLVYTTGDSYRPEAINLHNYTTGTTIQIKTQAGRYFSDLVISPDRRYLAYMDGSKTTDMDTWYVIVNSSGEQVVRHLMERDWYDIVAWQDSEHLIISLFRWNVDGGYLDIPLSSLRWNPFTGERTILEPNFPNIDDFYKLHNWGTYTFVRTIFDPNMHYALYPYLTDSEDGIILWDLINQVEEARLEDNYNSYGSEPKWSPDGTTFLKNSSSIQSKEELYLIDTSGAERQLTILNEKYSNGVEINSFSWSPDGTKVAFWVALSPDPVTKQEMLKSRLAVLDIGSQIVKILCIPGTSSDGNEKRTADYYLIPAPQWSADGTQLTVRAEDSDETRYLFVIDLPGNLAWRVEAGIEPIGWLATP